MYNAPSGYGAKSPPLSSPLESPNVTLDPATKLGSFFPEQPKATSAGQRGSGKVNAAEGQGGQGKPATTEVSPGRSGTSAESAGKKQDHHTRVLLVEDNEINMKVQELSASHCVWTLMYANSFSLLSLADSSLTTPAPSMGSKPYTSTRRHRTSSFWCFAICPCLSWMGAQRQRGSASLSGAIAWPDAQYTLSRVSRAPLPVTRRSQRA